MKIDAFELRRVRLPLVTPFRTSFGIQYDRDALLVRAIAGDLEGWGECVAMSEPTYSSEYVDGAQHVTANHLVPRVMSEDISADAVADLLAPFHGHRMAKAAVEMAVLDAELKGMGKSLSTYLGGNRKSVTVGVSVGILPTVSELISAVQGYLDNGYLRVKVKIEPGWDVNPVAAIREEFGDDLMLQVDANAAYTLADAQIFQALDDFGLLLIEQPFKEEEISDHANLARRLKTPICLDESIVSVKSVAEAISMRACSIVNIKAGRVGGYLEAKRIHDMCASRNVPVWCGGMLETGIGRAANLALASLPNFTLPGDISASDRYFKKDITTPFVLDKGTLPVPEGPGIGVELDLDAIDEFTTRVELLEA